MALQAQLVPRRNGLLLERRSAPPSSRAVGTLAPRVRGVVSNRWPRQSLERRRGTVRPNHSFKRTASPPLNSNVRHRKYKSLAGLKKLKFGRPLYELLSCCHMVYRRENIAFSCAAAIRTTDQVLSAGSPSVCSSLLKSVSGAVGLGVALGEPHGNTVGSQTNGSRTELSQSPESVTSTRVDARLGLSFMTSISE